MSEARLVLLFDGTCGFCTWTVDWIRHRDREGRIHALPNQMPGVLGRYGVTRAEADRCVWAFEQSGRRLGGAAAMCRVLREMDGAPRAFGALYLVPGVDRVADGLYWTIANSRELLSAIVRAVPECERPGVACQ